MAETSNLGAAPYTIHLKDQTSNSITVSGRDRWALEALIAAGEKGCKPADLTRLSAANSGVFPILEVMGRIDGYTSDTTEMPEFGALLEGDKVLLETSPGVMTPTPTRLVNLAEYLATLQQ